MQTTAHLYASHRTPSRWSPLEMFTLTKRSRAVAIATSCRNLNHRSFSATPRIRAEQVRIVEVSPRDGLQNEKTTISLATKIELIERLATTGVRTIEAGSFVAPKWVPQMADSAEVLGHIQSQPPKTPHAIAYNFLVPNMKGLQNMLAKTKGRGGGDAEDSPPAPITSTQNPNEMPSNPLEEPASAPITSTQDANKMPTDPLESKRAQRSENASTNNLSTEISLFIAATEAFSKANTNCTISESLERCKPIVALAKSENIRVRGYVSVALGCPYEGLDVSFSRVADITTSLLEMGVDEVSIADTTGMGTTSRVRELLRTLSSAGMASQDLALHFHDTYGQALVNVLVGLEHGIRTFDSSAGGLGGCPYSKGATGNVATEDLVHCLSSLGLETGVDLEKVAQIGSWISQLLGKPNDSRAGKAVMARLSVE